MQEQDNGSGNGNGQAKEPKQPQQQDKVVAAHKYRRTVMAEFKEWKKQLVGMIKAGSQVEFGNAGTYQFILPPALVKLVWTTTIKERARYEQQVLGATEQEAQHRAVKSIQDEAADATTAARGAHVIKLSQLTIAWEVFQDIASTKKEEDGLSLSDLGRAIVASGIKVLNDPDEVPAAMKRYLAFQVQATREAQAKALAPVELSKDTQETEAEARKYLDQMREDMVKDRR